MMDKESFQNIASTLAASNEDMTVEEAKEILAKTGDRYTISEEGFLTEDGKEYRWQG